MQEIATVLARPRLQKYLSAQQALRFITDLAAQTSLLADPPGLTQLYAATPTTTT